MLEVRQIDHYRVARYPMGAYVKAPRPVTTNLTRGGLTSAVLLFLAQGCGTDGVLNGVPAIRFVPESQARAVINRVFSDNGIKLHADDTLTFKGVDIILDGYSDSLKVGYEYVSNDEAAGFPFEICGSLDSAAQASGPYVDIIEPVDEKDYESILENRAQSFLDTLKAHGVI